MIWILLIYKNPNSLRVMWSTVETKASDRHSDRHPVEYSQNILVNDFGGT